MSLSELPEQGLFALYWLNFFQVSVRADKIAELWRLPSEKSPKQCAYSFPVEQLVAAGYVNRRSESGADWLRFNRAAFDAESFRYVLSASERYNWVYRKRILLTAWVPSALHPVEIKRLLLWRMYGSADEVLRACVRMHVFARWGYDVMRQIADYTYQKGCRQYIDFVGNDGQFAAAMAKHNRVESEEDERAVGLFYARNEDYRYFSFYVANMGEALRQRKYVCTPKSEAFLLSIATVESFRRGEDCAWALARLEELSSLCSLPFDIVSLLDTLTFLRGDSVRQSRQAKEHYCVYNRDCFLDVCKALQKGDCIYASRKFGHAINLIRRSISDGSVFEYPMLILALATWGKTATNRTGAAKLNRILSNLYGGAFRDAGNVNVTERICVESLECVTNNNSILSSAFPSSDKCGLACWLRSVLIMTQDAVNFAKGLQVGKRDGVEELAQARALFAAGYKSMAADMAAELRDANGMPEVSQQAAALFDEIVAAGGSPIFGSRVYQPAWERAFDAFTSSVTRTRNQSDAEERVTVGRFVWCLHVVDNVHPYVDRVGAVYIGLKRDGSEKVPVPVNESNILTGKYEAIMSEEDLALRDVLESEQVVRQRASELHKKPSLKVLKMLAALPELRQVCGASSKEGALSLFSTTPCRIRCVAARIAVSPTSDGGVCIAPEWPVDLMRTQRTYALRRDKDTENTWYLISITNRFDAILDTLLKISPDARMVVPKEGVARVEAFMSNLDRASLVAWGRRADATTEQMPRVPARIDPCVRLKFADDVLTVQIVIYLQRDPVWTAVAAQGMPERLMVRADGREQMVTRDFAAEEKCVAPIRQLFASLAVSKIAADTWTADSFVDALDVLSALYTDSLKAGYALEWPDGDRVDLSSIAAHSASFSGGETAEYWLSVSGQFTLDDGKVMSFMELLKAFEHREGSYVRLNDKRYLKLTAALTRRIEALKDAGFERGGKFVISPAALPSLERTARETDADDVLPLPKIVAQRLERIRTAFAQKFTVPRGLKCTMRPYQEEGYQWLSRLYDCGIGACLADDMGLGKTLQLIALILNHKAEGASLVVAPASVAFNWRNEIARFAPSLKCVLIGQSQGAGAEDVAKLAKKNHVVVTSYGVVTSRLANFASINWNVVVLDEAQAIKNHLTMRAKSVKELKARFRVAATGTPIENRLTELWSIFDFLNPGMLGGEMHFNKVLAPRGEPTPRLKRLVKPLVLRRIKRDVLTDLPEKEEITVPVVLGEVERAAYEAMRVNALKKLEQGDRENKIAILAELTRLRRFCCHPSLVMPSVMVSSKLKTLERLLGDLHENGHRALVFSQFVDYLAIVRKLLETNGWTCEYLDGATPKKQREISVNRFQAGEGDFFLISLKAGGMGLNLTAANYVILLDPWWNPAVENQAADRVHRIGQRLPVTVYRLIAQNTIEEKVVNLHAKKTALAEDVLSSGASSLSAKAMLDLLSEDTQRE